MGLGGSTNPAPKPEPKPTGPVLNTPDAKVTTEIFDAQSTGLYLVSSNLLSRPSAGQWFEQWYAVIGNNGPNTLCFVQAEVDFLSGGTTLSHHYGFADAAPYQTDSASSTACIAPGKFGVVYDNGFAESNVDLSSVDEIKLVLAGSNIDGAIPHPLAPTYTSEATADWTVAGTATAVDDVYNVALDVYAVDADGLVYDRQTAYHLDAFYQGTTWNFETNAYDQEVGDYMDFISFIPGVGL